jgi:hypothetical protein
MRTPVDERLIEQIEHFRLRYTCDACGHFDEPHGSCSLGYPNEAHQLRKLGLRQQLVFCKEFDLV